jgi:hypothetical protein
MDSASTAANELGEIAGRWVAVLNRASLADALPSTGPRCGTVAEQRQIAEGLLAALDEIERLREILIDCDDYFSVVDLERTDGKTSPIRKTIAKALDGGGKDG